MTQVIASNVTQRVYDAHWLRFARHIGVNIQETASFNESYLIGIKLTKDQFAQVLPRLATLSRIKHNTVDGVDVSVYLMGTRRFHVAEFNDIVAISEVLDANL